MCVMISSDLFSDLFERGFCFLMLSVVDLFFYYDYYYIAPLFSVNINNVDLQ